MADIKSLLACPACQIPLPQDLRCPACGTQYGQKYGVFDIVSPKLSGNQEILWRITDEAIEAADEPQSAENQANQAVQDELTRDYAAKLNQESQEAERVAATNFYRRLYQLPLKGLVCDLATGMGGMLRTLLGVQREFDIVCTDIDRRMLAWTRKQINTDDDRVSYVATDGRHLAFVDNTFDCVTSFAAFGNIPQGDKVARELYRALKPGGKLLFRENLVDEDSASFAQGREWGLENGITERTLTAGLKAAGFKKITVTTAAKAIWVENPFDRLPVAGDMNYYCIVKAVK